MIDLLSPPPCLQENSLCCLMQLAAAEGKHPLLEPDWSEHYSFPRELILVGQQAGLGWAGLGLVDPRTPVGQASAAHALRGCLPGRAGPGLSGLTPPVAVGAGAEASVQNGGHLPADLQVPGVFGDGRRKILCDELSSGEPDQSDGPKQRGRCWPAAPPFTPLQTCDVLLSCVGARPSCPCTRATSSRSCPTSAFPGRSPTSAASWSHRKVSARPRSTSTLAPEALLSHGFVLQPDTPTGKLRS